MMQITDLQTEQQIPPLLRLGFRPFFLGGAIFSIISVLLWLLFLRGVFSFSPLGGGYWWHIHEMVFGFGCAIIAGFLLTAVQNWTGTRGASGKVLLGLVILWLLGRISLFFPELIGQTLSTAIDLSFLPVVAFVLGKPIIAIKQYRNLFFVPLLALFTLANLEMHLSISNPGTFNLTYSSYSGVLLITFLMSVMAGRVVPMFTANGTQTPKTTAIPWLNNITNATLGLAMLAMLLQPLIDINLTAFYLLLIVAGVLQCARWLRWRPWITLSVPLLWSLHFALFFIWFGLIVLGISHFVNEVPTNHVWHLLTIGGIGGLILAMIARVSLGHTGRTLTPPKSMSVSFVLISVASVIRSFGPWWLPEKTLLFYDISALAWIIAFGIFAVNYGPMLTKGRIDNRPG